jgi:hypothetical protein
MTKTSFARGTQTRGRRWGPLPALLLAFGSVVAIPQSPAAAAPEDTVSARIAGTDKDFNGDGDADLAVSSAQAVHIIYPEHGRRRRQRRFR